VILVIEVLVFSDPFLFSKIHIPELYNIVYFFFFLFSFLSLISLALHICLFAVASSDRGRPKLSFLRLSFYSSPLNLDKSSETTLHIQIFINKDAYD